MAFVLIGFRPRETPRCLQLTDLLPRLSHALERDMAKYLLHLRGMELSFLFATSSPRISTSPPAQLKMYILPV